MVRPLVSDPAYKLSIVIKKKDIVIWSLNEKTVIT